MDERLDQLIGFAIDQGHSEVLNAGPVLDNLNSVIGPRVDDTHRALRVLASAIDRINAEHGQ